MSGGRCPRDAPWFSVTLNKKTAPWAYDDSVNTPAMLTLPGLDNLPSKSVVAFPELCCSLILVSYEDEATSSTPAGDIWRDICLDVKFNDAFLSVSQVEMILKHKLLWSNE